MNLYPRAVTPEDGIPFDAAAVEAEAAHVRAWLAKRRERQAPETAQLDAAA
ncbi:hypothetical protein [Coralloluteibacterium thermophilus]|uniref:Uncharacterized protein n=1 Tax=Coralloluteibacterium thermophilum TaxID=2707049 RepID=A0ABV9NH58_9GAMM